MPSVKSCWITPVWNFVHGFALTKQQQCTWQIIVLSGIQLVFFIVAGMVICLWFVMKSVLVKHQCLVVAEQCLHRAKDFSVSHAALPTRRLGMHKKLGGVTARGHSQDSNRPKGYPITYGIMLSSKSGRKKEEGRSYNVCFPNIQSYSVCFPNKPFLGKWSWHWAWQSLRV